MEKQDTIHYGKGSARTSWDDERVRDADSSRGTSTHPAAGPHNDAGTDGTITDGGAGS